MVAAALPEPAEDQRATSIALAQRIRSAIEANGGWLPFERYMQMALYEPGLGYYSGGARKIGSGGDFTTAPEQGDWLAAALAGFLAGQLARYERPQLLELGAGTGRLAADLMSALRDRGLGALDYAILETSAELRERQRRLLAGRGHTARWLERLPDEPFDGIVIANEVADALPVVRFVKSGTAVLPLGVTALPAGNGTGAGQEQGTGASEQAALRLAPGPRDTGLEREVAAVEQALGATLPDGYRSEICLLMAPWIASLAAIVKTGGLLFIDYGMVRADYYRPERRDGTLICHYRQRAHDDPLFWPGLQDISAWVDFSRLAEAAEAAGLVVSGYTTQAQFLLESIAADPVLARRQPTPQAASALQTLILPGEMGERFKLIWLTRGAESGALPGRDFRNRL